MEEIMLSVIVPVYNTKEYLPECLQSLDNQNIENMEIIMINDGSTDGSNDLLKEKSRNDKRFKYIEQENSGLSVARNTGLKYAKGKYVLFLDSDDWIYGKDNIKRMCQLADLFDLEIITGNVLSVYPNKEPEFWNKRYNEIFSSDDIISGEKFFSNMITNHCYIPMVSNYIYRNSFLQINQFLFEPGIIHEDELWTPQVLVSASRVMYSRMTHYCYRRRENSITTGSSSTMRISSLEYIIEILLNFYSEYISNKKQANKPFCQNIIRLCLITLNLIRNSCYPYTKLYDITGDIIVLCKYSNLPAKSYLQILESMNLCHNNNQD